MKFPESTFFGKRIPKESFYQRVDMNPSIKRSFIDDIDQIVWQNKLSPETLNISPGTRVLEIEVFYISLKCKEYNPKVIEVIEKAIPKHLLFILKFEDELKALINYKEESESQKGKFKMIDSYFTDWLPAADLTLSLEGLNTDQIYDGFIRQIARFEYLTDDQPDDISQSVERAQTIAKLEKKIAELKAKKRKEKQFNKQITFSNQIKEMQFKIKTIKESE